MELNKMARMIPMYRVSHKNDPNAKEMTAHLVEVDSEAGGREAQQRRHAFGPRHQPTCPPTQSRTLVITI